METKKVKQREMVNIHCDSHNMFKFNTSSNNQGLYQFRAKQK